MRTDEEEDTATTLTTMMMTEEARNDAGAAAVIASTTAAAAADEKENAGAGGDAASAANAGSAEGGAAAAATSTTPSKPSTTTTTSSAAAIDPTLLEEYRNCRDEYLRRKTAEALIRRAKSFDGKKFTDVPAVPTDEQMRQLEERREAVLVQVREACEAIRQASIERQVGQASLKARQEELELMKKDLEAKKPGVASLDDDDAGDGDEMDVDDDDPSDEQLAAEAEQLDRLQKRKAELLARLQEVEQENRRVLEATADAVKRQKAKGRDAADGTGTAFVVDDYSEETLAKLREQEAAYQAEIDKYRKIQEYYDGLSHIMGELRGARVVSVTRRALTEVEKADEAEPTAAVVEEEKKAGESGDGPPNDGDDMMVLVVKLLNKYDVEIGMTSVVPADAGSRRKPEEPRLKVVYARYLNNDDNPDNKIRGPAAEEGGAGTCIELDLPSLDDLVRITRRDKKLFLLTDGSIRFVVGEAISRIENLQALAGELAILKEQETSDFAIVKLPSAADDVKDSKAFGDEGLNIICTVGERDTATKIVLRLTPDCPMIEGSAYIAESDSENPNVRKTVDEFKEHRNHHFSSPVALVRGLKDAMAHQRLQEMKQD